MKGYKTCRDLHTYTHTPTHTHTNTHNTHTHHTGINFLLQFFRADYAEVCLSAKCLRNH